MCQRLSLKICLYYFVGGVLNKNTILELDGDFLAGEKLVNTETLARLFCVGVSTIKRHVQNGVLVATSKNSQGGYEFNLVESIQRYIKYLDDKAKRRFSNNQDMEDLEKELKVQEIALKEAKAIQEALKAAEMKGRMHASEDVRDLLETWSELIASQINAIPNTAAVDASQATTENEARIAIENAIRPIQEYLSNCKYNPDEFKSRVRQRLKWEQNNGNGADGDGADNRGTD